MTRPLTFGSALVVSLALLGGCAAPSGDADDTAASSSVTSAGEDSSVASDRESFPPITAQVRDAMRAEFLRRNGPPWQHAFDSTSGVEYFEFSGAFRRMLNYSAPTGPVAIDDTQAERAARAFATRNADLLGLTVETVRSLEVTVDGGPPIAPNGFTVRFIGERTQTGYEAFESVRAKIFVQFYVGATGEVYGFFQSTWNPPKLSLDTTPNLASNDPLVRRSPVGAHLERREIVDLGPHSFPGTKVIDCGTVALENVKAAAPNIFVSKEHPNGALTFVLSYDVRIEKDGFAWTAVVDAGTGELLQAPRSATPLNAR